MEPQPLVCSDEVLGPLFPDPGFRALEMLARLCQRLWRFGVKSLNDEDLVTLLLRGSSGHAAEILQGGLAGLMQLAPSSRPGFGKANLAILLAAVELARRLARARIPERRLLDRTDLVADYLYLRYHNPDQEIVGALYLDVRGRLIAEREIYRGTLSRATVEPRGVLKPALLQGATAVVLFHTHPSGHPSPSTEDLLFTRRMVAAGELVGVRLADHIILGRAGLWVSLQKRGAVVGSTGGAMNLAEGPRAVKGAVAKLCQVDEQLREISRRAPTHLGGVIECVRNDLLEDAITTLNAAASAAELKAEAVVGTEPK